MLEIGKILLFSSNIKYFFTDAAKINVNCVNITLTEVEEVTKQWLRFAVDRSGAKKCLDQNAQNF